MKYPTALIALLLLLTISACSPIVDARGHNTDMVDFKQIIPNQSTEADVRALLGSPSATANYGQKTWYYITNRKETVGIFAPEVTEQQVYAIHFTPANVVSDVVAYNKDDGKPVQYVSKSTPTEGNEFTFMQQLFGNFGRFNTPNRSITPSSVMH